MLREQEHSAFTATRRLLEVIDLTLCVLCLMHVVMCKIKILAIIKVRLVTFFDRFIS